MATSIDDILANLFAAITDHDYGIEGNGQGYDVKIYGVPELTELLESLGLIAPESSTYTLQQVYDAVEGFHYNDSSNFATLQSEILSVIEPLLLVPGETLVFEDFYAQYDEQTVMGSAGADTIIFGDAAAFDGSLTVHGDNGNDTISFGDSAAFSFYDSANVTVHGGNGDDTISFGHSAAYPNGNVTVYGGDGADVISFGHSAAFARGNVTVDVGTGDDTISFGGSAGRLDGEITVDGGDGADVISFDGIDAGISNLSIDLGLDDGAADVLIFRGDVYNTSVQNWIAGEDAPVDVVDHLLWTRTDNGTDTVFTAQGASNGSGGFYEQSLTFEGVTDPGTSVDVFLF